MGSYSEMAGYSEMGTKRGRVEPYLRNFLSAEMFCNYISAEVLLDLLKSSPEYQEKFIETVRRLDAAKRQAAELEQMTLKELEQRWSMVPRWRRAVILLAQWIQIKFTPKYL